MFAVKILRPGAQLPLAALCVAFFLVSASGCSRPVDKEEDIRPVRVQVLTADSVEVNAEFAGEVRPRVESRLGFRVGGKIIARKVDVGSVVKRGQVLMQLDGQDLLLAQAQANAGLRAAETTRDLALAEFKRYEDLRDKNFVSQAVLDAKMSALRSSQASVDQALAAYRGQANQAGYASLVADIDGVVSAVDAEVGQVVAPGTSVVRVATANEQDIVIGIPEDKVDTLRRVADVSVRLWARPNEVIAGKIREVSPVADASTRTYAVKVAIPRADARLGMTASVRFSSLAPNPLIRVPLTALFHERATSSVWLLENGRVKLVPVQIGGASGNEILLVGGVTAGQTIVTAGVNQLKSGQKVHVLGAEASAAPPAAGAAAPGVLR